MSKITGEDLGGLLFGIHSHLYNEDELAEDAQIIYYEEDLLELFRKIGLPEVIWGKNIKLSEFTLPEEKP